MCLQQPQLIGLTQPAPAHACSHCSIPITGLFVSVPSLLAAAGQPAEMTVAVRAYLLALLPNLWLDAVAR